MSERRADALDDICHSALTGDTDGGDPLDHTTDDDDDLDFPEQAGADDTAGEDAEDGSSRTTDGSTEGQSARDNDPAADVWDGIAEGDVLDELLAATEAGEDIDQLEALRRRIRVMEKQRRRRMRRKTMAGQLPPLTPQDEATRPTRHCDAHHLKERSRQGPTVTANAALLCRFHHRLVHEHRWRLLIRNDQWIAVDPHGRTWTGRPAPPGLTAAA